MMMETSAFQKKMLLGERSFNFFCVHKKLKLSFNDLNLTANFFLFWRKLFLESTFLALIFMLG